MWLPPQESAGSFRRGHQDSRIAGPPRSQRIGDILARYLRGLPNDLQYGKPLPIAQVKNASGLLIYFFQGQDMGQGQILDVDIIPKAAPVRSGIIAAVNYQAPPGRFQL